MTPPPDIPLAEKQAVRLYAARWPGLEGRRAGQALLAAAVRDAWGWDGLPQVERGERGKPFFSKMPTKHFNLSHSGEICMCALSQAGPVGVDVERVKPRRAGLVRYILSPEELAGFDGTWSDFYRLWTLKEAYCKYLGGCVYPPRAVPAPPPVPHREYAGEGWRAALCGAGGLPGEIVWLDKTALRGERQTG